MYTWHFLCDTCARLIEYEPGDFVIQDAWYCPRMEQDKLVINDRQEPRDVCCQWEPKEDR